MCEDLANNKEKYMAVTVLGVAVAVDDGGTMSGMRDICRLQNSSAT